MPEFKKVSIHLEAGVPVLLRNTLLAKAQDTTIELMPDFKVEPNRVVWSIRLNNGVLLEGRARIQRALPYWEGSEIMLRMPIQCNVREYGAVCPFFMLHVPEFVVPEFLPRTRK